MRLDTHAGQRPRFVDVESGDFDRTRQIRSGHADAVVRVQQGDRHVAQHASDGRPGLVSGVPEVCVHDAYL